MSKTEIPIEPGRKAPNVELYVQDGNAVKLSDFAGQTFILAFSASWDPSWAQQLSHYRDVISDSDIRLLDVSCEGVWCEVSDVRFPIFHESSENSTAAELFGVRGGQAVFVIDSERIVRWSHRAPAGVHPTADALHKAIKELGSGSGVSRRTFLISAVAASLALAVLPGYASGETSAKAPREAAETVPGERTIELHVNGHAHRVSVDPRTSLLDALRERMGLTGTKKGCDHGQCGACTVHIDGRRVNSCLTLAMQAEGSTITTIEGLAKNGRLHPVQEAFIKHDGFQCGYCTPGQVMSAVSCIQEGHTGSEDEIKEWMSGNICRCGAYPGICAAIAEAKGQI
jgi:xanthine dehydrogenase YagT iron-sulfur-binding subunit